MTHFSAGEDMGLRPPVDGNLSKDWHVSHSTKHQNSYSKVGCVCFKGTQGNPAEGIIVVVWEENIETSTI